ncbi:carboxylesterase family domain-containing protein [Ditylenchus destructor]|nr:carboxylesterase family domain-containing protein [Ditylenchus destructor]
MIFPIIFICGFVFALAEDNQTLTDVVKTNIGKVQGFTVTADSGFKTDVFLGIPFAQPPVGELRFEKPRPARPWNGVLAATEFGNVCTSVSPFLLWGGTFSDDCLYLNIYAPHIKKNKKYPVVVFIFAGGYKSGSARSFRDYNDISEHFVSKGIVAVMIQYRVGIWGFSALENSSLKGNLGYWDQTLSLKWVHENIRKFGGDPDRVTAFGGSAGGTSVGALNLSPHSRKLYSQAVDLSGSTWAEWALGDRVLEVTQDLLYQLNCSATAGAAAKQCLKDASNDELTAAFNRMPVKYSINFITFGPRVDGDFFPKDIVELIKDAPRKPTYSGCNEEEAMLWTVLANGDSNSTGLGGLMIPKAYQATYGESNFVTAVENLVATSEKFGSGASEVRDKVIDFYLNHGTENDVKNSTFYLRKYTQEAIIKYRHGWPVYLYENLYLYSGTGPQAFYAPSHGQDANFIFQGTNQVGTWNFDANDEKVANFDIDTLVAFIKTGNPSISNFTWPRTTPKKLQYAAILVEPEARNGLWQDRLNFWNNITKEYGFDMVRGLPVSH